MCSWVLMRFRSHVNLKHPWMMEMRMTLTRLNEPIWTLLEQTSNVLCG